MVNITSQQALPLMVISLPMAIIAVVLSIWGAIKSVQHSQKTMKKQANQKYFQYNAILSNLFNCGSCICVTTYMVWLTFYPLTESDFFLTHSSIRLRIGCTGIIRIYSISLFYHIHSHYILTIYISTIYTYTFNIKYPGIPQRYSYFSFLMADYFTPFRIVSIAVIRQYLLH